MRRNAMFSRRGLLVIVLAATLMRVAAPAPALAAGVVGTGSPANCTESALRAALGGGGTITFNCGAGPVTITIAAPMKVSGPDTLIDGGGAITLQAQNTRIFEHASTATQRTSLTLRNITLTKGRLSGSAGNDGLRPSDPVGAAVYSYNGTGDDRQTPILILDQARMIDNDASLTAFADAHGGGAIFMRGGWVIVRDSVLSGNDCQNCTGGAIHIMDGALTMDRSTVSANTARGAGIYGGGAIFMDAGWKENFTGAMTIRDSAFEANAADNGGGAIHYIPYRATNAMSVSGSIFVGNASNGSIGQGGAIYAYTSRAGMADDPGHGSVTITDSLFHGNSAQSAAGIGLGGALWLVNTVVSVTNSTLVGNTAYGDTDWNPKGGAMYLGSPRRRAEISNSTIAANHAGGTGGGIAVMNGNARIRNTIIANNTANNAGQASKFRQQCSEELVDGGNNIHYPPRGPRSDDATCLAGKSALSQQNLPDFRDPLLQPLADNGGASKTLAITSASPAYNGGNGCEPRDQRGAPRPQERKCDIGAYELVRSLRGAPSLIQANRGVTLLVGGAGFAPASTVLLGGVPQPTTYVSAFELRVTIGAAQVASPGTIALTVSGSSLTAAQIRVVAAVSQVHLPVVRR